MSHAPGVRYQWFWRLATWAFWAAAAYHAVAILAPGVGGTPPWRHGLFVLVDAMVAVCLVHRPPWLPFAFAILTCQAVYSHGGYGWRVWSGEHRVAWFHWGVALVVIVVLVMLSVDAHRNRRGRGSAAR